MRLAFVLTRAPVTLDADSIAIHYAVLSPRAPSLEIDPNRSSAETCVFKLSDTGETVVVTAMPMAVPDGEAESASKHSLSSFRDGGWSLPNHAGHIVVALEDAPGSNAAHALMSHARVVAAVAQATNALGVYVGEARATHNSQYYVETVREMGDEPPLTLLIGLSLEPEGEDRAGVLTMGMRQLGFPDALVTTPLGSAERAVAFAFNLLAYIVRRGRPFADGETTGRTATEKLVVRYEASPIEPGAHVFRIDMP